MENKVKIIKSFTGKVISTSMQKSVVVSVIQTKMHRIYKKAIRKTRKFTAHNEIPDIKTGDTVKIVETRPVSKTKFFKVEKKVN